MNNEPIEYGKTDMTAAALIERAVRSPLGWKMASMRWAAVADVFKLGSRSAISICEAAGYPAHETKQEFKRRMKEQP
jgi:hypothetical protein